MSKKKTKEDWLIFVDTNILLDFYRLGGESARRQLDALERHKSSLILSDQIRMEFLKNRQKVIVENISKLQKPNRMSVPPIVTEYQPAKMLAKHLGDAIKQYSKILEKIENALGDPVHHDAVYQALGRIFDYDGVFNLRRPNKLRFTIRNLAKKRFLLGYPPRKNSDTSMGDSVNWEWIIHCANNSPANQHILIVSRDNDYGVIYRDAPILNDWLRREFKDRVSLKRKIELTNKLTVALKKLDERVTPEDETEEEKLLKEAKMVTLPKVGSDEWDKLLEDVVKELESAFDNAVKHKEPPGHVGPR